MRATDAVIDCHFHIIGNGSSGSGCWVRVTRPYHKLLARIMLRFFNLPPSALAGNLDELYLNRLVQMVRESSVSRVVGLAHELPRDRQGNPIDGFGSFYVPNDYVLSCARRHPEILAGVSIHPARPDALEELERCIQGGAAVLKLLPNCQNIDCSEPRFRPFWERLAAAGIPLLAHTGGELSVPVYNPEYADPRTLRLPLECGVNVIAAHAGSRSLFFDPDYVDALIQLAHDHPNIYVDNSALCTPTRAACIRRTLESPLRERVVFGSDLPIPPSCHAPLLRGLISKTQWRECRAISNPLERDLQLKRAIGYPAESFNRITNLIPQAALNVSTATPTC
ncbi:MAG: amidohydrolase family protein [Deltaproteobacteria bacterium]|nr:amidohydrolase family protein [Deltaproteobacteria bacterium]